MILGVRDAVRIGRAIIFMVVLIQIGRAQGIASQYPGDKNIHQSSQVIFTEMAEESTMVELLGRWSSSTKTGSPISLDTTTSPSMSPGKQSIRLTTTAGVLGNPGTVQSADLFKLLNPDFNDSLFFRFYIKYNTYGTFHHSGVRIGGAYPASPAPNNFAGKLPNDSIKQFFYAGAEVSGAHKTKVKNSTFDFYNYWRHQRHSSFFPDSVYYGNSFINSNQVTVDMSVWNCIEVRIKLNTPPDSSGEISMWINGKLVSEIKKGTTGTWVDNNFFPGAGTPFEGFSWRGHERLKLNFIWLTHFVDNDSAGIINSINYDHIVVAKSYIGPIAVLSGIRERVSPIASFQLDQNYPNPFNPTTTISFTLPTAGFTSVKIFDAIGREVTTLVSEHLEANIRHQRTFNAPALPSGLYFYQLRSNGFSDVKRMIYLR